METKESLIFETQQQLAMGYEHLALGLDQTWCYIYQCMSCLAWFVCVILPSQLSYSQLEKLSRVQSTAGNFAQDSSFLFEVAALSECA